MAALCIYVLCVSFVWAYIFCNARIYDANDVIIENVVLRFIYAFLIAILFIPAVIILTVYYTIRSLFGNG